MGAFALRYSPKDRYYYVPVSDPRVRLPEAGLADRGEYHITIITPDEVSDLLTRKGWKDDKLRADIEGHRFESAPKYVCLGKQEKGDNAVYYIVVRWPKAQEFRARFDLGNFDFHVTLGFRTADIHDVPKNSSTCIGKLKEDCLTEQTLHMTKELEQIQQAMEANKVIAIQYDPVAGFGPVARLIEPYSFRPLEQGVALFGWDVTDRRTKSFYADRIRSVRIQSTTFKPRWDVEPDSLNELAEARSGNPFPFASATLYEGVVWAHRAFWISPDSKYIPVHGEGHSDMAKKIVAANSKWSALDGDDAYRFLLGEGWVRNNGDSYEVYDLNNSHMKLIADFMMSVHGRDESDDTTIWIESYDASKWDHFETTAGAVISEPNVATAGIGRARRSFATETLLRELFETADLRDVIVVDVDGTLVDVDARASAAFRVLGMDVAPDEWEDTLATLDHADKDKFLRLFLSDKFAKMDKPYVDVFSFLKRLVDRTGLPVILLTGRPDTMRHTDSVATMLMHHGIPVSEVIQRPESESRTRTAAFKVKMIQQRHYNPMYLLDDDPRNVVEFEKTWPEAMIYRIDDGVVRKVKAAAVKTESEHKTDLPIDIQPAVIDVLKAIRDEGGLGIVVGGAVRDAILGKVSKDIDIEVYNIPGDKLAATLGNFGKVNAVGKSFGVYKLKIGPTEIDFSLPRKDRKIGTGHRGFEVDVDHTLSYRDAAKRRDFTINTLGYDPLTKTVYDPHGGMDDLKRGVIRMTDPEAFKEDPLRVLRMAQFAARFGFDVDPETVVHAKAAPELETLPKERLFEEFKKALLRAKRPGTFVHALARSSALERIVPELHGKENEVAELLDKVAPARTGKAEDDLILMFSAIAWETTPRFLGGITTEVDVIKRVSNVYAAMHGLKKKWPETDEDIRRWLHTIQPANLKVVEALARAVFGEVTEALFTRSAALIGQVAPIVLGRDLQKLGLAPGPAMGKLLKQLHDLQLAGKFSDLEGGLAIAQKLMIGMQESTGTLLA